MPSEMSVFVKERRAGRSDESRRALRFMATPGYPISLIKNFARRAIMMTATGYTVA